MAVKKSQATITAASLIAQKSAQKKLPFAPELAKELEVCLAHNHSSPPSQRLSVQAGLDLLAAHGLVMSDKPFKQRLRDQFGKSWWPK